MTTNLLASLLLGIALKGACILAVAALVTRMLALASAALRHLVWVAALGGILLLPALAAVVPPLRVPTLASTEGPSAATMPRARSLPASEVVTAPLGPTPRVWTSTMTVRGATEPTMPAPVLAPARVYRGPQPTPNAAPLPWLAILVGLWALGAIAMLARLSLARVRVSGWRRTASLVTDPTWLSLSREIARRLGVSREVVLLESDRGCAPMTWGVIYPVVLLPAGASVWPSDRRAVVLAHEIAHIRRHDALTQLGAQAVLSLLWFHPLVWLAVRRMRVERERACDDLVLAMGARASDYARDLLAIAQTLDGRELAVAALAMARRSDLEGRLLAILEPRTSRGDVSRARLAAVTVGVLALAAPLAAMRSAPAARPRASVARDHSGAQDSLAGRSVRPIGSGSLRSAGTPPDTSMRNPGDPLVGGPNAADSVFDSTSPPAPASAAPDTTPPPDLETLVMVARGVTHMTSDHEKGELLRTIADHYLRSDALRTAYLDAVASMTSDYEKGRALTPLLLKDTLPPGALIQAMHAIGQMTSDAERAKLLTQIAVSPRISDAGVRTEVLAGVKGMTSDYERAKVLRVLSEGQFITPADLIDVIAATEFLTSSSEKSTLLLQIATRQGLSDPAVRKAFVHAAETVTSDYDYRRLMAGIVK
jgi:beta-lactamase regulating signal transducer with metallopeptidase domain